MENYRPLIGTDISELDTPCLIVDLDLLDRNFQLIADTYRDTECKMRAHIKNLKSPPLAHMQIRAGGTVGGVCAAKVSEAEAMVDGGIDDILIPNQVVAPDKIARLCTLAKQAKMMVAADNTENLQAISEAASEVGVSIGVVIEVDTQMQRAGIRATEQGVVLAKVADSLPGIEFKGVMKPPDTAGAAGPRDPFLGGTTIHSENA